MTTVAGERELTGFLLAEASQHLTQGRSATALVLLVKGFMIDPAGDFFPPLADLCRLMGRWEELERFSRQRILASCRDPLPWFHLAGVSLQRNCFMDAVIQLRESLQRSPAYYDAWIELGNTWKRVGEISRAITCYRLADGLDRVDGRAADNYLLALLFSDRHAAGCISNAHREWGRRLEKIPVASCVLPVRRSRIRIGYLSPDLREHSVTCFLEPLLRCHDHQQFEVICYQCNREEDHVTVRLQGYADCWRNISGLGGDEAAELVRGDGIHVLVELAGHTAGNRLSLLARRPALLQGSWLGYPHSTGHAAIDFRISDSVADPPGDADLWHTEQLVRLPAPFLCYGPPPDAPEPVPRLAGTPSGITFASFNRIDKASPTVLSLWRTILERLPDSRLMLKSEIFADPRATARFIQRSALPGNRLVLLPRTPDRTSHLTMYNHVDIALDTFPYNGTTTTCEALWMGVPVVSLAGRHHASRVGKSLLGAIGLGELATERADEYVELACTLAAASGRRTLLRKGIRSAMTGSALCDGQRFARNMEQAYRIMLADRFV